MFIEVGFCVDRIMVNLWTWLLVMMYKAIAKTQILVILSDIS